MTNTEFRNCGYRSPLYSQYDSSATRGCGDAVANGCSSDSTTFGFLAHSDQYIPQVMQGTKNITFTSCGRRFYLYNFNGDTAPETVSRRSQNWLDADGSVTGLHVPSIIGSGKTGSQGFWQVEDSGKRFRVHFLPNRRLLLTLRIFAFQLCMNRRVPFVSSNRPTVHSEGLVMSPCSGIAPSTAKLEVPFARTVIHRFHAQLLATCVTWDLSSVQPTAPHLVCR